MRSKVASLALLAAAALGFAASGCSSEDPTPTPVAPATFQVSVGAEDLTEAYSLEAFLPGSVTINAGDTVEFRKQTIEPHTITFNLPSPAPEDFLPTAEGGLEANPVVFFPSPAQPPAAPGAPVDYKLSFDGTGYLNSGFLSGQQDKMSVTFTATGTYEYVCKLHPSMKGTVTVQAAGAVRSTTQQSLDASAATELTQHKSAAQSLLSSSKPAAPSGQTRFVLAGAGSATTSVDLLRFLGGENLTVGVGDSVSYSMASNVPGTPHTITFLSGGAMPELINAAPQPAGPPRLLLNPQVLMPAPLPPTGEYGGTGYFNSGLLLAGGPTPQEFTVSFTAPGTYKYLCVLHDANGMNGTITVR